MAEINYEIIIDDTTQYTIELNEQGPQGVRGIQGETGNGIINTEKVSTVGLVDTYHVNYTNGNFDSFTVTNGRNGEGSVADVLVNGTSVLDGNIAKVIVPTNNNELTNGAGYITGITSSDVTTALGYTPYDSTNPNGYTSNIGTVTSVNNIQPVNGNVTVDLNGKADIDLSNVTPNQSFKSSVIDWITPDYANGIDITTSVKSASGYTTPSRGMISTYCWTSNGNTYVYVDGHLVSGGSSGGGEISNTTQIIVEQGAVISADNCYSAIFFPLKGVNQ